VWFAWQAAFALRPHGSDSIAGAEEFIEASGSSASAAPSPRVRAAMKNTPFGGRKVNKPDQAGVIYMAPARRAARQGEGTDRFFARTARTGDDRNRRMVAASTK
jgi:hypothetical protein